MDFHFDFGPAGAAQEGYTRVTSEDGYDVERGYGFVRGAQVTAVRRSAAPLTGDFCIPFGASFVVDVPDGNYMVDLHLGDELAPTCTSLKTNGERLILKERRTREGQMVREKFAVNVRGGKLKLSFDGVAPRVNALDITYLQEHLTLFLAGDSTVTDPPEGSFPQSGWGQMLPYFFKHDVAVANHAVGGRSSKSFIREGRLEEIKKEMKEGDFLFIQFGHNDQKPDEARFTEPGTTYKQFLMQYVSVARTVNATPVLITSVQRRYFDEDGKLKDMHGAYLDAVRELAGEEDIPLIDLAEKSKQMFEELGPEETKKILLWGAPGEWLNYSSGVQDNTHFQENGSLRIAGLVVQGIRELHLMPLPMYLK